MDDYVIMILEKKVIITFNKGERHGSEKKKSKEKSRKEEKAS